MVELRNEETSDFYDEDEFDDVKNRYLTFSISGEIYAIEILYVTEIIGILKISALPDMPDFIKGVLNLRGNVIPVMDIRKRFKIEEREYDERTCIVVVKIDEHLVGMIVDRVKEVIDIPADDIAPPPKVAKGENSRFIQGIGRVGDEIKIILNTNSLLYADEIKTLEEIAA